MNEVYFANEGLSSTSANYIANKSKEIIEGIVAETRHVSFINETYTVVGHDPITATVGKDKEWLDNAVEGIKRIGELSGLNAWLREAIKEKEKETKRLKEMDVFGWAEEFKKELPERPILPPGAKLETVVFDDDYIIERMDVHERQKMLMLQAKAAAIGKFVHKGEVIEEARKNLHKQLGHTSVAGIGSELTITTFTSSIDVATLDSVFLQLQEDYRKVQAELNGIKHKIELKKVELENAQTAKNIELKNKAAAEYEEYCGKMAVYGEIMQKATLEFDNWRRSEIQRVAELKIVIPDSLQEIYSAVKNS